jgi:hypothetical protein
MGFLDAVFGAKPDVADLEKFNLTDEQLKAIMGNIANFGQISNLGNMFQDYVLGQYEKAIPGFKDILAQGGSNVKEMVGKAGEFLKGMVPKDVEDFVKRSSAYQNLTSGTAGSAMGGANTARNLGLTSLGMIDKGAELEGLAGNALQRWAGLSGAQSMSNMLLTPKEQSDFDLKQAILQRNVQQQKNNVAAAPNPGLQQLNQWVEQLGGTIIASYLGKPGKGDYKTSYNADSYLGGNTADPMSDVSNPGYLMDGGGGDGGGGVDVAQNDPALSWLSKIAAPTGNSFATGVGTGLGYGMGGPASAPADYFASLLYNMANFDGNNRTDNSIPTASSNTSSSNVFNNYHF